MDFCKFLANLAEIPKMCETFNLLILQKTPHENKKHKVNLIFFVMVNMFACKGDLIYLDLVLLRD